MKTPINILSHIFGIPFFIIINIFIWFLAIVLFIFDNELYYKTDISDCFKLDKLKEHYKYFID